MSPRPARVLRGRAGDDPATALREHLIATARDLLAQRAVSTLTTRQLARAARVSDGVLYNHFADKHDLLVTALVRDYAERAGGFPATLPEAGSGNVEENLCECARAVRRVVGDVLPTAAGLVSEPALLHRFLRALHSDPLGPGLLIDPLVEHLTAEQHLGRLGPGDPRPAATLLFGAMVLLTAGELLDPGAARADDTRDTDDHVRSVVRTLLHGLAPGRDPSASS
ncbi:MAG: hypothetical protein QG608_3211 [Actinomycetota bacterium]|nr:hypothetical protein [Actinomycetota bacterium]